MPLPYRAAAMALAFAALPAAQSAHAQTATSCPAGLDEVARCYRGADANGANYWIAIPNHWNKALVVHAHGGPRMSRASNDNNVEDLERFAVTVRQGFAWAGSAYRRPGYGVLMAAEDTDNLRKLFIQRFGQPARTILHGQSWGGNVAEKTAELYGKDPSGKPVYDGVILTSGVLGGGTKSYDFRADLRAVYQYYCRNLPAAGERSYPLWEGLGAGVDLKRSELLKRINDCTGVDLPAGARTAIQQRNLENILKVVRIPQRTLTSHME